MDSGFLGLKLNFKGYRWYAYAFIAYLVIALVMFWSVAANFSSAVPNGGAEVYQSLWGLWWVPYSLFTLHLPPFFSQYLFYPVGANLISQPMSPLSGILAAPVGALLGLAAEYNVIFFLSFALGGLFMFMLAKYLVRNDYAAFIAGLIFAFSPMHIAQSYSQLQWTVIEFIPLFVLCFLLMLRSKKRVYAVFAALSFVLLAYAGDAEQGIMMAFFAILSLVILAAVERREAFSKASFANLGIFAAVAFALSLPFLLPAIGNLGFITKTSLSSQPSATLSSMLYSDKVSSFLLPSYYNGLFHGASLSYLNSTYGLAYNNTAYLPDLPDRVSYIGYSVLFLVALAVYFGYRKRSLLRESGYWIAILVIFFLLALGPYIQLSASSTGVPSLFMLYRYLPVFNLIVQPGRFDVVVTLALAALAAIGFEHLSKSKHGRNAFLLLVVFSALILIEYNGMPLSTSFAGSLAANAKVSPQIGRISTFTGNFSVLMLPALPNLTSGSFLYPGIGMYYQTAFRQRLLGGYTSAVNSSQEQLLENVPIIDSAGYLQSRGAFIYPYPIIENFSNLTVFWLTVYKVGIVGVVNPAYNSTQLSIINDYLQSLFGSPIYGDSNVTIYSSSTIENENGGRSLVSYIVGDWQPGYGLCGTALPCNLTTETTWWGGDPRGITLASPNATTVKMSFEAQSFFPNESLYLYLNGGSPPFGAVRLGPYLSNYSIEVSIPAGLSQIALYSSNSPTLAGQNYTHFNFGIRNIAFGKG